MYDNDRLGLLWRSSGPESESTNIKAKTNLTTGDFSHVQLNLVNNI